MAKKPDNVAVGEEVVSYLRHSVVGLVPLKVKIKKIVGDFGRKTFIVLNDVGGEFPTRTIKKLRK